MVVILLMGCATGHGPPTGGIPGESPGGSPYVLVIDAGSTGSRIYVYHVGPARDDLLPSICLLETSKVEPGISQFKTDSFMSRKKIGQLVEKAKNIVPSSSRSSTPCFLIATAGMRIMGSEERQRILEGINGFFRLEGSFDYQQPIVLSGAYEGLYAWLAVNYLNNGLEPDQAREGMLEMGGASTQIAFALPAETKEAGIARHILGRSYRIASKSYLHMETNQARYTTATQYCYPVGLPTSGGVGAGDFQRCAALVRERFDTVCDNAYGHDPRCLFAVHRDPAPKGDYYALSGLYHLYRFLSANHDEDAFLRILRRKGAEFCGQSWADISEQHGTDEAVLRYLKTYCFASAYYWLLLSQGYGMNESIHSINAVDRINGMEVNWTLGFVIDRILGHAPQSFVCLSGERK